MAGLRLQPAFSSYSQKVRPKDRAEAGLAIHAFNLSTRDAETGISL